MAQTADALLLIQPQSRVQVPGKLFEYIQIGRPILAYVLPQSPIERILEKSGIPYCCLHVGDSPGRMDDKVDNFFSVPTNPITPSRWFEEHFNVKNQAQYLAALLDSLHSARGTLDPAPEASIITVGGHLQ